MTPDPSLRKCGKDHVGVPPFLPLCAMNHILVCSIFGKVSIDVHVDIEKERETFLFFVKRQLRNRSFNFRAEPLYVWLTRTSLGHLLYQQVD